MAEELEHLCKEISLMDREKIGISISEGEVSKAKMLGDSCLVGKIWTEKAVNKEAFKTVLSSL
jgi:hypothetical protein